MRSFMRRLMVGIACACLWFPACAQQNTTLTERERAVKLAAASVARFENGEVEQARQMLEEALQIDAGVYEAHFWLGRIYAQQSASSPQALSKAVAHFRQAVQLQPYGEEGDLSRAWLLKVAGRPKSILLVPIRQFGETKYQHGNTAKLLDALGGKAAVSGYPARHYQENWNNRVARVPTREDVQALALDQDGLPHVGWIVFAGADGVTTEYNDKVGNIGTAHADLWIGDALTATLYPPMSITANSFVGNLLGVLLKEKIGYQDAMDNAWQSLTSAAGDRLQKIIALESDPQLLDEMLVPLPGDIYCRSTAPTLADARTRPAVAFYAWGPEGEMGADTMRKVNATVQRHLLAACALNCISPTYTRDLLEEPADTEQAAAALLAAGVSDYALAVRYERLEAVEKESFLSVKAVVHFRAQVVLASREKGVVWRETVSAKEEKSRALSSDAIDLLLQLRNKATQQLIDDINIGLTRQILGEDAVPKPAAPPKKPGRK